MKFIFGLGNPGTSYTYTRHNAGFLFLDFLARAWEESGTGELVKTLSGKHYTGTEWRVEGLDEKVFCIIPTTFMNLSGDAVREMFRSKRITEGGEEHIIVAHDDIDLPLGSVKISFGASSAGQKGVQNIIDTLGTKQFVRIRIGIAPTREGFTPGDARGVVLKKFSVEEKKLLKDEVFPRAVKALMELLRGDVAAAQRIAHVPATKM